MSCCRMPKEDEEQLEQNRDQKLTDLGLMVAGVMEHLEGVKLAAKGLEKVIQGDGDEENVPIGHQGVGSMGGSQAASGDFAGKGSQGHTGVGPMGSVLKGSRRFAGKVPEGHMSDATGSDQQGSGGSVGLAPGGNAGKGHMGGAQQGPDASAHNAPNGKAWKGPMGSAKKGRARIVKVGPQTPKGSDV